MRPTTSMEIDEVGSAVRDGAASPSSPEGVRRRPRTLATVGAKLVRELRSSTAAKRLLATTVATAAQTPHGGALTRRFVTTGLPVGSVTVAAFAAAQQAERRLRNVEDVGLLAAWLGQDIPPLGTWAIEADLGVLIHREIQSGKRAVVEFGSGTSTLLIAAALAREATGRLVTFEHDAAFAADTRRRLDAAGLASWVEVVVSPLRRQVIAGREVSWHDVGAVLSYAHTRIELMVVDGPPQLERWARRPAVDVLHERLAPGATVLLDDGRRAGERRTAFAWAATYPDMALYWHDTLKGTWKLTRVPPEESEEASGRFARRVIRNLNHYPTGCGRWPVRR